MTDVPDDWSLTQIETREGATRFFRKNLRPSVSPGDAAYPFLAFLTFRYRSRDSRSLPEGTERVVLQSLDDREAYSLEEGDVAVLVGAVLGSGIKDLVFYVRDLGAFATRVAAVLEKYPQFAPSCELSRDPTWEQYAGFPGAA